MDLSLVGVNSFMSTHSGRDQVGKFVQYATRGIVGFLTNIITDLPKDSPRKAQLEAHRLFFRKIMVAVGDARRTVRWLASLGVVIALKKLAETGVCPWSNKIAFAIAQCSLLWWHLGDNYRWLVMNQLVTGDSIKIKNVSFTGFVVSSSVSSAYFANQLINPPTGVAQDSAKQQETQRNLIKNLLTLVATLHISEIYQTSETICGVSGAICALIVIWETFPKNPVEKKQ